MTDVPYFPPPPSYTSRPSEASYTRIPPRYIRAPDIPTSPSPPTGAACEKLQQADPLDRLNLRRQATWRMLPTSRVWTLIDEWWLWELLSWTFAAGCMGAIAGLLAVCNDKPIPAWPWGLTINAYVSILGAFVKAALLLPTAEALGQLKFNWFVSQSRDVSDFQIFDQASRGPWGSLVLILKTRGRALGAFGAAVILLSTALDPFFQQVVVFPLRTAAIGTSTITRARLFTSGVYDPQHLGSDGNPLTFPDRAMLYHIQPFLYYNSTPKLPDVPLTCSTGECDWEPYHTLGVCNECADVSHLLRFACLDAQNEWQSNITNGTQAHYPKGRACGYFLNATSSDPMLMTGYGKSSDNNETLLGRLLPLSFPTNYKDSYFNGSVLFKDIANPIVDAIYVFTPGGYDAVQRNATPVAKECSLRWCVQKINSTVHGGVLSESVLETIDNKTAQPYPFSIDWATWEFDYSAIPRITLRGTNESFGTTTNDTAFTIVTSFYESMRSYFTTRNGTSESWMRYTWEGSDETIRVPADSTFWWTPHNVSQHFDSIAEAMTRVVRTSSNGTDEVAGVAMGPQTYVHIRWEWFSLPLILLFFSLAFLVSVMFQCRADGVEIWKTSALAVLMHDLSHESSSSVCCVTRDPAANIDHTIVCGGTTDGRVMARLRGKRA